MLLKSYELTTVPPDRPIWAYELIINYFIVCSVLMSRWFLSYLIASLKTMDTFVTQYLLNLWICFGMCLRSVRNRSLSRAFVCQSIIPALMTDGSTPFCHLNLGLPRLLCSCGRPKKTLRAGSSVSMRTTWPAHRSLASFHTYGAKYPFEHHPLERS